MISGRWRTWACILVWIPVVLYGASVARKFFHTADSAVYVTSDDGMANISYAIAETGRYGFLSSPVLAGMPRHDGLFSYGPFYFYLGAGLTWMFGYNLVILRSIHLFAMLAVAGAAGLWFRRAAATALGTLTAIGILMAFERAQWPMVRPDSLVSVFAVVLVMASGAAIRDGRPAYWLIAGFGAACAAFTHLVAWSLVPAAVLTLACGYLVDARADDGGWRRPLRLWSPVIWLALGGLAGAALFYASFGFRIGEQLAFLADYQRFTGSMTESSSSFSELIGRHFTQAYWYLPYPLSYLVWATLAAAIVAVPVLLAVKAGPWRREAIAAIAPPTVTWVAYLASLGFYNNVHAGYAILNQVMWLWTGTALVHGALLALSRWTSWQKVAGAAVYVACLVLGVGMLSFFSQRTDYRALASAAFVSFEDYTDHVLENLPARARAWGSVEFGIENPDRLQLVQFWDAAEVLDNVDPKVWPGLIPDYVVWGHTENGSSSRAVLVSDQVIDPAHYGIGRLMDFFPGERYALVSLTAASPYGVTRVYAWTRGLPVPARPTIHVYDEERRQWNEQLGPVIPIVTSAVAPATVATTDGKKNPALQTMAGELPAGTYLLSIALSPDLDPEASNVFIATPTTEVRLEAGTLLSSTDVSPWVGREDRVHLILRHAGGRFYISQFGSGASGMIGAEAAPIVALPVYDEQRREDPADTPLPARAWGAAFPEIAVAPTPAGQLSVAGNRTRYGYQAYGPRIAVEPGEMMRLRVPVTVTAGNACLGVLDGTELQWLVAPDRLLPEYTFRINDSHTVKPVLADCTGAPGDVPAMSAVIGDGGYARWPHESELYVDRMMRELRKARPR